MKRVLSQSSKVLATLAIMSQGTVWAACSAYIGDATINETHRVNNANQSSTSEDFVEVKVLNSSLASSVISSWKLKLCYDQQTGNGNNASITTYCREESISSATVTGSYWVLKGADFPSDYIDYEDGFSIELRDANGDLIDYLNHNNYYTIASGESCSFTYDTTSTSTGNGQRQLRRWPDGTGDWDALSGNSTDPTEGYSNDGTDTTTNQIAFFELNDTSGNVTDSLNNVSNGSLIGNATITNADDASACLAGYITENTTTAAIDAIDTGIDVDDDIGNAGTIMFWYKSSAENTSRQLFDASRGSKYFYFALTDANQLSFGLEDSSDKDKTILTDAITSPTEWTHMAVTWDLSVSSEEFYVYVNGSSVNYAFNHNQNLSSTIAELDTLYFGDNRTDYFVYKSTNNSANGYFDDIRIFSGALTSSEVLTYAQSVRICDAEPAVCFTDDFNRSEGLGADWATTNRSDASAAFGDPTIIATNGDGRLRLTDAENRISTAATLMRLFPSAGNKLVIEFTLYSWGSTANNGNEGDGITIALSDEAYTPQPGGYAGSLGYAQRTYGGGATEDGFAGGWVGIGIDEWGNYLRQLGGRTSGFSTSDTGRIPDTVAIRGSGSGQVGYDYVIANGLTTVGDTTSVIPTGLDPEVPTSSGHIYRITIDHEDASAGVLITVERDTTLDDEDNFTEVISTFNLMESSGQAEIPDKLWLTITSATGGSRNNIHEVDDLSVCAHEMEDVSTEYIDHYELDRDQLTGLTCEPINVTVRACLDGNGTTCSQYTDTIDDSDDLTATFTPSSGWESSSTHTFDSGDTIEFQQTTAGTYTLGVASSTPSLKPLSITSCYVVGSLQDDCSVEFVDAAYRFFESASGTNSISTVDLVAAQTSGSLYMRAIKTDEATGQCVNYDATNINVSSEIGTTCTSTASCLAGEQVIWTQNSNSTSLANPTDQDGGSDTTTLDVSFGSNDTADFSVIAPDVGIQPLTVSSEILDVDGNPSGEYITGALNLRVRPASIELNTDVSGTHVAGDNFTSTISARDANGDLVPSFGRITGLYNVDWSASTVAGPSGGTLGSITTDTAGWSGTNYDNDANNINESVQASISYSEVGEVNLVATIDSFLGSTYDLSTSTYTAGRFIPAYITATQNSPGSAEWGTDDSNIYQGQMAALTDLSYTVQAFNSDGGLITNYVGSYVNFGSTMNALEKPDNTVDTSYSDIGGNLTNTLSWTVSDDGNFDGSITLTAAVSDLLWDRNSSGATTNDIATTISELNLIADALKDNDNVCVKSSSSEISCQQVAVDIEDRTLYLVRANMPDSVDGGFNRAEVDVTLEALVLDANGDIDWDTLTTDNDLDSTVFSGLSVVTNNCTTATECANAITNAAFSGPDGTGTTLSGGLGLLTATSTSDLSGAIEAQLIAPSWLSWDWNRDGTYTLDTATILFGDYQGQAPVLFMRPGYR
ncbi:DUF6701 domain-containing protein [Reinekea marinisedimentorum]|uniref:MSHA biogenesis protein MshQ n=1 Tax=Reinekea marinisedimentorum TaxID=230495 RepID=A0A4V2UJV7_9GAMM|nr:DUF6701 domain-containing protein [Reinekea marinisedimentorum]TCS41648.1 MSHA biogenesis protein MshQ [Reinekea marinisedimentorum]